MFLFRRILTLLQHKATFTLDDLRVHGVQISCFCWYQLDNEHVFAVLDGLLASCMAAKTAQLGNSG